VQKIINDILKAIENHLMIEAGGIVRFSDFGSSSLNILVQYYVRTNEWEVYLSTREEINFRIMEIVQANGAVFAFPPMGALPEKVQAQ